MRIIFSHSRNRIWAVWSVQCLLVALSYSLLAQSDSETKEELKEQIRRQADEAEREIFGGIDPSSQYGSLGPGHVSIDGRLAYADRLIAKWREGIVRANGEEVVLGDGYEIDQPFARVPDLVVLRGHTLPAQGAVVAQDAASGADSVKAQIDDLMQTGFFEYVEPDWIVTADLEPTDDAYVQGNLWGLNNTGDFQYYSVAGADIAAPAAWDITTGSRDVIVGVIDSGVRYTHQDLAGNMWVNTSEIPGNGLDDDANGYVDDIHGINAIVGSGDPMDDRNHGTHVAGTIGAVANGGGDHVGVAWNVRIMALKFLNNYGHGSTLDAIHCIDYALVHGAHILNNSWGGGGFSQALEDAIGAANQAGVLFVASAGNSNRDVDDNPHYPASYDVPNVVSVAAIESNDELAYFSNYGVVGVDVAAPGHTIYSSVAGSDTSYSYFSGTSMAAPHVAGVAALVLSHYPEITLPEMVSRLKGTAHVTRDLFGQIASGGRVNALSALENPDGNLEVSVIVSHSSLPAGREVDAHVTVSDVFRVVDASVTAEFDTMAPDGLPSISNVGFLDNGVPPDLIAGDGIYSGSLRVPTGVDATTLVIDVAAPGKTPIQNHSEFPVHQVTPVNDDFGDRIVLDPATSTTRGSNVNATLELFEPHHPGESMRRSVWWSWRAGQPGFVVIDTFGSNFDTGLAVYTGSTLHSLNLVASNDDSASRQSRVGFVAERGETYHLRVTGWSNSEGNIVLNYPQVLSNTGAVDIVLNPVSESVYEGEAVTLEVLSSGEPPLSYQWFKEDTLIPGAVNRHLDLGAVTLADAGRYHVQVTNPQTGTGIAPTPAAVVAVAAVDSPPANDDFVDAIELFGTRGLGRSSNLLATQETGPDAGLHTVWWKWTAPSDGHLTFDGRKSGFRSRLSVFEGSSVEDLTLIEELGASHYYLTSPISIFAQAGTTYHVALGGLGEHDTGGAELAYSFFAVSSSIVNGSFESGSVEGWQWTDLRSPYYRLRVREEGRALYLASRYQYVNPSDGRYSLIHGFDGYSPGNIQLFQHVRVDSADATLFFDYRAAWDFGRDNTATLPRMFSVVVETVDGSSQAGGPTNRVEVPILFTGLDSETNTGMRMGRVPLGDFNGSVVRVEFVWNIPERNTGPGYFELDNVRIGPDSILSELPGLVFSVISDHRDVTIGGYIISGTSGVSGYFDFVEVGGTSSQERRGLVEFPILGDESRGAFLSFEVFREGGIQSFWNNPFDGNLIFEIYDADNLLDEEDYQAPVLGTIAELKTSTLSEGDRFSFDVTDWYNERLRAGTKALGVRVRRDVVPDSGAFALNNFKLEVDRRLPDIVFPDSNLEMFLKPLLGISDRPVNQLDLRPLESLVISGEGISNLSGLEYAVNLTRLILSENQVSDLTPLGGMTGLTSLDLSGNDIGSLEPIAGLTELRTLRVSRNAIQSLDALHGMTRLTGLHADGNQISDLSGLEGMTDLTVLFLDDNQIANLEPLSAFDALSVLFLSQNLISDVSDLQTLYHLTILNLADNQIDDISALEDLVNLIQLDLSRNQVADASSLAGLFGLRTLGLAQNHLTDIGPLAGLTNLRDGIGSGLQIQNNWLRVGPDSAQRAVINQLNDLEFLTVDYWPQRRLDLDEDGMDDRFEQLIIDYDSNDAFGSVDDVLPGDDFDNDGISNLREYRIFTIPTDYQSKLRMGDIDRDGIVSILDIVRLHRYLHRKERNLLPEESVLADLDDNGVVDNSDNEMLIEAVLDEVGG